jgi:hypothetical protein
VGNVSVMRRLLMIASIMMLCGLLVVLGSVGVMF